jgi:hypothetical protein
MEEVEGAERLDFSASRVVTFTCTCSPIQLLLAIVDGSPIVRSAMYKDKKVVGASVDVTDLRHRKWCTFLRFVRVVAAFDLVCRLSMSQANDR